jgi:serine/threonine-protein kinase HipA
MCLALAKTEPILRLHQEDLCQALGVPPTRKYQSEGGPSPEDIVALLAESSDRPDEDVATFVEALALSWLTEGTDAHAKNYSLLHSAGGRTRLAPLYDVASALPYKDLDFQRLKLAMKIGGKYRLRDIGAHEWKKFAKAARLPEDEVTGRVVRLASELIDRIGSVRARVEASGVRHPIVRKLEGTLRARAIQCRKDLGAG